jgi:hypothetical protein
MSLSRLRRRFIEGLLRCLLNHVTYASCESSAVRGSRIVLIPDDSALLFPLRLSSSPEIMAPHGVGRCSERWHGVFAMSRSDQRDQVLTTETEVRPECVDHGANSIGENSRRVSRSGIRRG